MEHAACLDAAVPSTVTLPMGGFMTTVEGHTLPKHKHKVRTVHACVCGLPMNLLVYTCISDLYPVLSLGISHYMFELQS